MRDADTIHAALETVEQDALRAMARRATADCDLRHCFGDGATFDRIPGGIVARRNNHVKPLRTPADGEYGG